MQTNAQIEAYLHYIWPEARASAKLVESIGRGKSPRHRRRFRFEVLGKMWRVEVADTPESSYYLRRSARWARYLAREVGENLIVAPCRAGICDNIYITATPEVSDAVAYNKNPPEWMLRLGRKYRHVKMSQDIVQMIGKGFLQAWPPNLRTYIKRLEQYSDWIAATSSLEHADLVLEHGDLAPNNILSTPRGLMLLDFEFVKIFQVSGFDRYSNLRARKMPADDFDAMQLRALHRKWELIQAINNYWENQCLEIDVTRTKKHSISFAYIRTQSRPRCATGVIIPNGRIVFDKSEAPTLEGMKGPAARALANRWATDRQRVIVQEIALSCGLVKYVQSFSLKEIICEGLKSGKLLRVLRRLVAGKQLFAYTLKQKPISNVVTLALGNIGDYMGDRFKKQ